MCERGPPTRETTTAIVLCGGQGARLGGVDKPLVDLAGRPLLGHVLDRLRPQVGGIVLSCAGAKPHRDFGCPVVVDAQPNQGPLGGIVSALATVSTPWVLTSPCDTPFLPMNLVDALAVACRCAGAAVAAAGGRRQNLCMLLEQRRAASLAAFFAAGGRAAHRWLDANGVPAVELPATAFLNVNTEADLQAARERFAHTARDVDATDSPRPARRSAPR